MDAENLNVETFIILPEKLKRELFGCAQLLVSRFTSHRIRGFVLREGIYRHCKINSRIS